MGHNALFSIRFARSLSAGIERNQLKADSSTALRSCVAFASCQHAITTFYWRPDVALRRGLLTSGKSLFMRRDGFRPPGPPYFLTIRIENESGIILPILRLQPSA